MRVPAVRFWEMVGHLEKSNFRPSAKTFHRNILDSLRKVKPFRRRAYSRVDLLSTTTIQLPAAVRLLPPQTRAKIASNPAAVRRRQISNIFSSCDAPSGAAISAFDGD
jgi:hypothetical protein